VARGSGAAMYSDDDDDDDDVQVGRTCVFFIGGLKAFDVPASTAIDKSKFLVLAVMVEDVMAS